MMNEIDATHSLSKKNIFSVSADMPSPILFFEAPIFQKIFDENKMLSLEVVVFAGITRKPFIAPFIESYRAGIILPPSMIGSLKKLFIS